MHGLIVAVAGERRLVIDTELPGTSLVMAWVREGTMAWHEPPNIISYAEKHEAEIVGLVHVPNELVCAAKMHIALQEYFAERSTEAEAARMNEAPEKLRTAAGLHFKLQGYFDEVLPALVMC